MRQVAALCLIRSPGPPLPSARRTRATPSGRRRRCAVSNLTHPPICSVPDTSPLGSGPRWWVSAASARHAWGFGSVSRRSGWNVRAESAVGHEGHSLSCDGPARKWSPDLTGVIDAAGELYAPGETRHPGEQDRGLGRRPLGDDETPTKTNQALCPLRPSLHY